MLVVYVLLALLNYSVVQSLVGSAASRYLTERCGGSVQVSGIGANLLGSVVVRGVEMITPEGDTVATSRRIICRFKKFPFHDHRLEFDRVYISYTYFHLTTSPDGISLQYLIKGLQSQREQPKDETPGGRFIVNVGRLTLNHVRYKMDLAIDDTTYRTAEHGVDVRRMDFSDIRARFNNVRVDADHVTCRMDRFSAHERSGLNVRNIRMNVFVSQKGISATDMELITDSTTLRGDVLLHYGSWDNMKHFIDSTYIFAKFLPGTSACMTDAAYWAHTLWGMDERVDMSGTVHGPVADMHVADFTASFGKQSSLHFDGSIIGLPRMDSTVISVNMHELNTTYADLKAVRHPGSIKMKAEHLVQQLDDIHLSATFSGTIRNFFATVDMLSRPGRITADLVMRYDPQSHDYTYVGEVSSPGLQVSRLLPNDWVSRTAMNLSFEGQGLTPQTMNAALDGTLHHTMLRGNNIASTQVFVDAKDGRLKGDVRIVDTLLNVDMTAEADLNDSVWKYQLGAAVRNIDVGRLHLLTSVDSSLPIQTRLQAQAFGNDLESLYGTLLLDDTRIGLSGGGFYLTSMSAGVRSMQGYKTIDLNCDVLSAVLRGRFQYSDLPTVMQQWCNDYLPAYYKQSWAVQPTDEQTDSCLSNVLFDVDLRWHDTAQRISAFLPQLHVAEGSYLRATYNVTDRLRFVLRSDSLRFGGFQFTDIGAGGIGRNGQYFVNLDVEQVSTSAQKLFNELRLNLNMSEQNNDVVLRWDNHADKPSRGNLQIGMLSSETGNTFELRQGDFFVYGAPWQAELQTPVEMRKGLFLVKDLKLMSEDQLMQVNVLMDEEVEDVAEVEFRDFDIGQLSFLTQPVGLYPAGRIDGQLTARGFEQTPYVNANLSIASLSMNNQLLGDASVHTDWDATLNHLNLQFTTQKGNDTVSIVPISAGGYMDMSSGVADAALHFNAKFDGFDLAVLSPLVQSFSSSFGGLLHGTFEIGGTLSKPSLLGMAYVEGGNVLVDFLGVPILFSDSIAFTEKSIMLTNFILHDRQGNTAFVSGSVNHNHLKDFALDIALHSNNFLFLNTKPQADGFYGTVYAAANGRVQGPLSNLNVNIDARTNSGSSFAVPINNRKQVKEADFIEFVSDSYEEKPSTQVMARSGSSNKYRLTLNLSVTPDVKVSLPMDFSPITANIKASGTGDLQVGLSSNSNLFILGNYEIGGGTVGVSMPLKSLNFAIDEGSTINFPGSVSDVVFDINAAYSQRVNMSSLTGSLGADNSQKSIQVENVVALKGTMQNPTIDFDLRLPNADQSVQDEVFAYIDRNNERDMLNQTFSLLLFNRFYSNANTATATSSGGLMESGLSGGYSVMANTLGSFVSSMVDFVDVNFDYKSATELTREQFEVDISKEWNKFYIETTFGMGGEAREMNSVSNTTLTGDMLMGYRFSPRFHMYVFNRSNTNDYTRYDLPYKQGVGLKYTRDFNRWGELFRHRKEAAADTLTIERP